MNTAKQWERFKDLEGIVRPETWTETLTEHENNHQRPSQKRTEVWALNKDETLFILGENGEGMKGRNEAENRCKGESKQNMQRKEGMKQRCWQTPRQKHFRKNAGMWKCWREKPKQRGGQLTNMSYLVQLQTQ